MISDFGGLSPLSYRNSFIHPHPGFGKGLQAVPMTVVPNCALILPQRYKKDFEQRMKDKMERKFEKESKTVVKKHWKPGGKKLCLKPQQEADQKIRKIQRCLQRKQQQEIALSMRQPTDVSFNYKDRSSEINSLQMDSYMMI